jgi:hypothetical protein
MSAPKQTTTRPHISTNEVRSRLAQFALRWADASSEEADEKLYTAEFLACFGLDKHHYQREYKVLKQDGSTGYMDGFIPGLLIIEGKSLGKNLAKARQQAEEYRWACPPQEQPRFVLLHDFARLVLFDLSADHADQSFECTLAELPAKADWFRFLWQTNAPAIKEETEADRLAAEQMAVLHEALLQSNFKGRDLEVFLTRLLFCLFADDTAIFGNNGQFSQFLATTRPDGADLGERLAKLFEVLNLAPQNRSRLLDEDLAAFAYINGQLFAQRTPAPDFDASLRQILLNCAALDWSHISPAIFGAMFQGVLEQSEPDLSRSASRRELGAHYTSERNILRAIGPLFMDDLRSQLQAAGSQRPKLLALYERLPTLNIFDPACGCGNFLVIAYRELRRLEMDLIDKLFFAGKGGKGLLDVSTLSRVTVSQFYGIEIDASAAHIAQVALWITDHQMNLEAASRFGTTRPSVPLTRSAHIHHGNALQTDWAQVLPPAECSYIVGNPPFIGKKEQNKEQKADLAPLTAHIKGAGVLDYVTGWYFKAATYMQANPAVRTGFVSTNSICQGEQVGVLWGDLLRLGVSIHFAHRTFKWSNEGKGVAAVHCIIVGFALQPPTAPCRIFDYSADIKGEPVEIHASRINPYLVDAPDVLLERRTRSLCGMPMLWEGITPLDNGILAFTPEERAVFLQKEPSAEKWFKPWLTGNDFINGNENYCLWLSDISPTELRSMPHVMEKIAQVKHFRENSKSSQQFAATPWLFRETSIPRQYILIPKTSSERRAFFPLGFVKDVIATNSALYLESSSLYHFGLLSSTMHNAWMRTVAGRLKSDYRYSASIVYNNYPWPQSISDKQQTAIETAAQAVLDARARYPEATLADLYDPLTMPAELVQAHTQLDRAVDAAYAYKGGRDDAPRVAFLFALYSQLAAPLDVQAKPTKAAKPKRK